jgi:hypothetical protein
VAPLRPAPPAAAPDPFVRQRTTALTDAAAWHAWLTRWAVSIASLVGGLVTLFVFRRGVPGVGWIVGYIVVLWLLFTLLTQTRARLLARGRRLWLLAGEYTVQTLYHGLLLFVLPGYFACTTFDAVTLPFFLLLTVAALVTTIDPWYRALVHPYPWVGRGLFAVALFAGLNLALPLVGMPPAWALLTSAALAGVGLTPALVEPAGSWPRALARGAIAGVAATLLVWLGRPAVPPAPLQLLRATLARDVANLDPVEPVGGRIPAAMLAAWGGLAAFTPVVAPEGLRQPIVHVWRHDGRAVSTVTLPTAVVGGRAAGFRTFSRKTDFPPDARGRWSVDVLTASGQLIGRLRFTVVP